MKTMPYSIYNKDNIQETYALVSSRFLSQNTQIIGLKRGNVYCGSALAALGLGCLPHHIWTVCHRAQKLCTQEEQTLMAGIVQTAECIPSETSYGLDHHPELSTSPDSRSSLADVTAQPLRGQTILPNSLGNLGAQSHNYISISPLQ